MTAAHLVFEVVSSAYTFIAIQVDERDLVDISMGLMAHTQDDQDRVNWLGDTRTSRL